MSGRAFWRGRRVLLTGHTGFKGAWLSLWLEKLGADVSGLSLVPDTAPSLFALLAPFAVQTSQIGDIRDRDVVARAVRDADPQIVIHMGAQSLVRRSYAEPVETYATNVMGTAHLLDALRGAANLQAVLVVTTDKVYRNNESGTPFGEQDPLGGHDPYSASKAATEIVTESYAASFLAAQGVRVATARAGNVIGGGDWAQDRLIPDLWRAAKANVPLELRNPQSTRPWQHVLEPLGGYLIYAERLAGGGGPAALNFGPDPDETMTVADVANAMIDAMQAPHAWRPAAQNAPQPKEAHMLALDPALAKSSLGWRPRLAARQALLWTADWYKAFDGGAPARALCLDQIARYEALA